MREMTARYRGECAGGCGRPILPGQRIYWDRPRRAAWHLACAQDAADPDPYAGDPEAAAAARERRRENYEYQQGVADAERYQQDKKMFGEEVADRIAAQEEFDRYWKYGEDY
jgi:hypothetical protein